MSIKSIVTTGICAAALLAGGALAQTWAPPAEIAPKSSTPPPAATPAIKVEKPRKAKEKECSAQADAKGLHKKARKSFLDECKKS